jgi:hypothetical protein
MEKQVDPSLDIIQSFRVLSNAVGKYIQDQT